MVGDVSVESCPVHPSSTDLVDPYLYARGDAHNEWRRMRKLDRLEWQQVDPKRGFWSVVTYPDADLVLRDTQTFTSTRGTMLEILGIDDPAGGQQLAVTDPPQHTRMHARLKKALAVKPVARQRAMVRGLVCELLEPLGDGVFDFGAAMLSMPMAVTGTMMGLPRTDWPWLTGLTTACIAADDPAFQNGRGRQATLVEAHRDLFAYFYDVVARRRRELGDDLLSVLIETRFDGRHMTDSEIVANCYSLLLGANVTTPHGPAYLMAEHIESEVIPDWTAHPQTAPTGIEESLRWASPVNHLLRYATRDTVVHNTPIAAGEAVVVWVASANRDAAVFRDPFTFDIRRRPNKHLAFGIGPHYCIGHNVARLSLAVLFEELFGRYTDFRAAGPPQRMVSNFVSGYKHVPISSRRRPDAQAVRGAERPR